MKIPYLLGVGIGLCSVLGVWVLLSGLSTTPKVQGSIDFASGAYYSTTTSALFPTIATLKNGGPVGLFGSVVITKSGSGSMTFYDATTSNINLRAASLATSTLILADFGASPTVGTYVFDSTVRYGILMVDSGNVSSTTVTWK